MAKNMRPNANIPPLRFKLDDLRRAIAEHFGCSLRKAPKHQQYKNGVLGIKAYHRQAANMSLEEQRQYINLMATRQYVVKQSAEERPSNHWAYKNMKHLKSWPKWVLLNALYPGLITR